MILYKTNKNWFGDIGHLAKSWTMVRITRSVIAISIYATLICLLVDYMDWGHLILMDVSVFSLLGVILSILLVFRTNTAYDRWWEARKQWGALVNNTRNFAIYVHAMFPKEDAEVRRFFGKNIANFCLAFVEHLREGTKLEELIYLTDQEVKTYQTKSHVPNYIASQLFDRLADAHRKGEINEGDYINIKAQHQSLLDILGACERIKKTPIPFSYAVYLKIFISVYGLFLPIVLASALHLWTVLVVALFFFALLGVELMGEEIEDPFGLDCNDLPTGSIARTIKANIFEILEDRPPSKQNKPATLYQKVF